ncbi:hypothetical protein AB0M54_20700 [Actinoplanes sp. NPDC051470]
MRTRIGSTIAVIAAAAGLAAGVAGPIYSALGGDAPSTSTSAAAMGRIMR